MGVVEVFAVEYIDGDDNGGVGLLTVDVILLTLVGISLKYI